MSRPLLAIHLCVVTLVLGGTKADAQSNGVVPTFAVVTRPTYAHVTAEVTVKRPVAEVWARVGDFCDIRDWIPTACEIESGRENELGAVRTTGREIMVGRTQYSYTYAQAPVADRPYNMFRGTLEARPIDAKTTKLIFTQFSDVSVLESDAARSENQKRRATNLARYLQGMKTVAEGGKMPRPSAQSAPLSGGSAPTVSVAPGPRALIVARPTYAFVTTDIMVDKPIEYVWSRVGDFCDIRDWVPTACEIISGKENDWGNLRTTGNEFIVGKTQYSYTYAQAPVEGRAYNMYHGTLEARPITATTTRLVYSLMFDNSMLQDGTARAQNKTQRLALIERLLKNMKTLSEAGKVAASQ